MTLKAFGMLKAFGIVTGVAADALFCLGRAQTGNAVNSLNIRKYSLHFAFRTDTLAIGLLDFG